MRLTQPMVSSCRVSLLGLEPALTWKRTGSLLEHRLATEERPRMTRHAKRPGLVRKPETPVHRFQLGERCETREERHTRQGHGRRERGAAVVHFQSRMVSERPAGGTPRRPHCSPERTEAAASSATYCSRASFSWPSWSSLRSDVEGLTSANATTLRGDV